MAARSEQRKGLQYLVNRLKHSGFFVPVIQNAFGNSEECASEFQSAVFLCLSDERVGAQIVYADAYRREFHRPFGFAALCTMVCNDRFTRFIQ